MERPIEFILQEEQAKLFFHDLITHLETQGYKQGTWGSGINEEGLWEERDLFYEFENSFGHSEVELHLGKKEVIVSLREHSFDRKSNIHEFWSWRVDEYQLTLAITKLDDHSQVHQLFSSAINNPQLPPTEMEYKENVERQLKLFAEAIDYLQKLGFTLDNNGCLDIHLHYIDDEFEVSIELGENEGVIMVEVYEYNLKTKHKTSTDWSEPIADFNYNDLIKRLRNSFHFSQLGTN